MAVHAGVLVVVGVGLGAAGHAWVLWGHLRWGHPRHGQSTRVDHARRGQGQLTLLPARTEEDAVSASLLEITSAQAPAWTVTPSIWAFRKLHIRGETASLSYLCYKYEPTASIETGPCSHLSVRANVNANSFVQHTEQGNKLLQSVLFVVKSLCFCSSSTAKQIFIFTRV